MFKNYLKIAIRNLRKQKAYAVINISGLSVGMACSIFILLWVQDEVSFDRFHEHSDRLYRVMQHITYSDGRINTWDDVPVPLGETLEKQCPEITHAVLVDLSDDAAVAYRNQAFREIGMYAGPAFFEIFSFPFMRGNPATALDDPDAIAISERLAEKYFGAARQQFDAFKQELLQKPGILQVTSASQTPLRIGNSTISVDWHGKHPNDAISFHIINVNYDFFKTLKIGLKTGRTFSKSYGSDLGNFILNEQAAKVIGLDDPVGERLTLWGKEGQIVGVAKDFHIRSFYTPINPVIIRLAPQNAWNLFVRMEAGKTPEALASLETVHRKFNPNFPFVYKFLDEGYEQIYESEITMEKLANAFAALAIFISCLGLFGLASFMAEQRTKEIGIRKVLGASTVGIVNLFSTEFVRLVLFANLIAWPIAYFAMNAWLQDFAYRTEIGWWIFALAGGLALLIALLTVSTQAIKAALANPVDSLRYE